jgi:hypothetical protein
MSEEPVQHPQWRKRCRVETVVLKKRTNGRKIKNRKRKEEREKTGTHTHIYIYIYDYIKKGWKYIEKWNKCVRMNHSKARDRSMTFGEGGDTESKATLRVSSVYYKLRLSSYIWHHCCNTVCCMLLRDPVCAYVDRWAANMSFPYLIRWRREVRWSEGVLQPNRAVS